MASLRSSWRPPRERGKVKQRELAAKGEQRWSALPLSVTAQFMVILDVAIVNVAPPSIKSDLDFSETNLRIS